MNFVHKWIKHATIIFSYFYSSRLNFCSHCKETFFPRKIQLTLALTGEIVCPLLISPFSNMWFFKKWLWNIVHILTINYYIIIIFKFDFYSCKYCQLKGFIAKLLLWNWWFQVSYWCKVWLIWLIIDEWFKLNYLVFIRIYYLKLKWLI